MYGSFSLSLFGPFEARYNERSLTNFATDKIRALLAYLAIEAGKPHRRETLATLLWPDHTDENALRNLRQSIYRLRQALQEVDPDLPDQLITQDRHTIQLNAEIISLDISRFKASLQAVRNSDDPFPHLDQIITLYQGDLLQGLSITGAYAFEEWLNIQREIFHQQVVEAYTRFLALHETRGDHDTILNVAPKFLLLEPWHEETHRQLMRAHLQKGNRSRAIAQYQELTVNLSRELGVEPSPATTALFKLIETDTVQKLASPQTKPRHHIPSPISPLIGRQPEIEYLTQTLQDPACRLLTVTGPGGIGKTRLCIETAHRLTEKTDLFSKSIFFIPLNQIEQGNLLVSTVAQTLGINIKSHKDPQRELIDHLQGQQLLLILDNFEHLLISAADGSISDALSFVVDVLNAVPTVNFLVTSRDPLSVQLEWIYPIEGLPYTHPDTENTDPLNEPAAQLFIQNARRFSSSFEPETNIDSILTICRLTDGLPLAIEMAATWLRIYTCQEVAQSIAKSLDFLTSPFRDAPERQRSIRVILDSTWEQLNSEQQNILMALSVFRSGFTIQAALFVTEAVILDLSILIEKSLLRRTSNKRYFLHELVSQFSREKLAASGNEQSIQEKHARYYLTQLAEQTIAFNGPNPIEALTHIRQDLDNLRVAWNWSASQANLPLIETGMKGLAQFWVFNGAYQEGETSFQIAINSIEKLPQNAHVASIHSFLASALAWLQMGFGKNEEAEKNLQTALELADKGDDVEKRAIALSHQGWLLQNRGQLDEAEVVLNEARSIFEKLGNQFQLSLALIRIGGVYWWRNNLDKSLEYYEQSLRIEENLGNIRGINRAYSGLGMAYMYLEKLEQALGYMEKALQLDRELGNQTGIVRNLGNLGNIYLRKGMYELAVARYQEALEVERKTGGKTTSSVWLSNLGRVYFRQHDHAKALECYEEAITLAKKNGNKSQLCEALLGKAGIFLLQDHMEQAQPLIEEGLTISYEVDRKNTKLRGMILKARWLVKNGETQKARQLLESSRETLASEYKETETNARLFYELWKIDQREEDARQALALYETCQAKAEQIEYTERITELTSSLRDRS